jgi:hypothetical protein
MWNSVVKKWMFCLWIYRIVEMWSRPHEHQDSHTSGHRICSLCIYKSFIHKAVGLDFLLAIVKGIEQCCVLQLHGF